MTEKNKHQKFVIVSIYSLSDKDKTDYLKKIESEKTNDTNISYEKNSGKIRYAAWIGSVVAALLVGVGVTLALTNKSAVQVSSPESSAVESSMQSPVYSLYEKSTEVYESSEPPEAKSLEAETDNDISEISEHGTIVETINKDDVVYTIYDSGTMVVSGKGIITRTFGNSKFSNLIIQEGIDEIDEDAFRNCTDLKSVTIPDSLRSINYSAFKNCTGLKSIVIPESVDGIYSYAFDGCTNLTEISVPDKAMFIGESAFNNTGWYNDKPDGDVYIGNIYYKYKGNMPADSEITIIDGTRSIASQAFMDCTGLRRITIPDSVTEIDYYTFQNCTMLEDITLPDSVITIGALAFDGTAWYNNQPDGDVYAGKVYYKYKGDMPSDTTVSVRNGTIGIACEAFRDYKELDSVLIPDTVKKIGYFAFSDCYGMESIVIPSNVESVSDEMFYNCTGLKNVTITNGVKGISECAFFGCTGINSITIPDSVTEMDYEVFDGCDNLKTIYVEGKSRKPDSWSNRWLGTCTAEVVWNA